MRPEWSAGTRYARPGSQVFTSSGPPTSTLWNLAREPNFSYRLLRVIYPVFRALFPNQVIRADDLARAMVDVTIRKRGERGNLVFENRDIRAMVESPRPSESGGADPTASSRLDGEKQ